MEAEQIKDQLRELEDFLAQGSFFPLSDSLVFKEYFSRNPEELTSLLLHCLPLPQGSKVTGVRFLKHPSIPEGDVKPLRVVFEQVAPNGSKVTAYANIEAQNSLDETGYKRQLYHWSTLSVERDKLSQEEKGYVDYEQLVYSLSFVEEKISMFQEIKGEYFHLFAMTNVEQAFNEREGATIPGMSMTIVELAKFCKGISELKNGREDWCFLLKNSGKIKVKECQLLLHKKGQGARALKSMLHFARGGKK